MNFIFFYHLNVDLVFLCIKSFTLIEMKNLFLISLLILISSSFLNGQQRFLDDVFSDDEIRSRDIVYAKIHKSLCWNKGDTNALHHFSAFNYTIDNSFLKDTFNLHLRFIDTKNDTMSKRPVVIFVKSGYLIPVNGGLRTYWGSKEDALLKIFIRKGYAVVVFDFRRGWDAKEYFTKECFGLEYRRRFPNAFCENSNNCSQFSFIGSIYRVCQDLRAVHRKLLSLQDSLRIDSEKIIYFGSSTGSYATLLTSYATKPHEFPSYREYSEDSNSITLAEKYGSLDAIGVPYPAESIKVLASLSLTGALKDTAYLDIQDKAALVFAQGIEDQDVLLCKESLTYGYYTTPEHKEHLTFDGFGAIMEKINNIRMIDTSFQAIGNLFHGVGHAYYEDKCTLKDLRMKCGNGSSGSEDCLDGDIAHKLSFIDMFVKQIYPLMNRQRMESVINYYNNANECETCNIVTCGFSSSYCRNGVFDCVPTSVKNTHSEIDFIISPSIQQKNAHIYIQSPHRIEAVSIFDVLGHMEIAWQMDQDISDKTFEHVFKESGMYFIQVKTDLGIGVKKIIIN